MKGGRRVQTKVNSKVSPLKKKKDMKRSVTVLTLLNLNRFIVELYRTNRRAVESSLWLILSCGKYLPGIPLEGLVLRVINAKQ